MIQKTSFFDVSLTLDTRLAVWGNIQRPFAVFAELIVFDNASAAITNPYA